MKAIASFSVTELAASSSAPPPSPPSTPPSDDVAPLTADQAEELFRKMHGDRATPEKLLRAASANAALMLPDEWMASLDVQASEDEDAEFELSDRAICMQL